MTESKRTYMNYQDKEFIQIPEFSDYYLCKETCEILSTKKGLLYIMRPTINSTVGYSTYLMVRMISNKGKSTKRYIHRLMAEMFLPNPNKKKQVNHIDGNKHNNSLDNLEWVSHRENALHASDSGLLYSVAIQQYDLNMNFIAEYKSIKDAEKATKVPNPNITKVAKGIRRTAGGFIWKYVTP